MEVFDVFAAFSLTDNFSGPLGNIRNALGATDVRTSALAASLGNLTQRLLPMAMVAGVVLGALAPAVGVAANFEQAISGVGAVSGASATEMAALEKAALDLGASTAWSASEVANAEKALAMTGYSTQENIAALPGVLDLASAAQEDLGQTANIASNILSSFGLEAGETGRVADILASAFTSSNTTLSSLASTMANAAPIAAAAGASISEVAAMAGKLGDVGIDASVAGTGIKIMFQRLQAPTGAAAKALTGLGLQTKDAAGNMLPIFDILKVLETSLNGMGSADKAAMLKKIFGEEAVGSVQALMTQGIDTISDYSKSLENPGKASAVAAQQLDNFNGAVTILGSGLEGLGITIGSVFLQPLKYIIQGITVFVGWLNILASTSVGQTLTGIAGAAAAAVIVFTAWAAASWGLAVAIPAVTAMLAPLAGAVAAISWPIWVIIGAAAMLALAWKTNFGGMTDTIARWWNSISLIIDGVKAVFSSLSNGTGTISGELATQLQDAGLVGWVESISRILYKFQTFWDGMWNALSGSFSEIKASFSPVFIELKTALNSLETSFKSVFEAFGLAEGAIDLNSWSEIGDIIGSVISVAFKVLASAIHLGIIGLKGIISVVHTFFELFTGKINLAEAGRKLIATFVEGIRSVINKPYELMKSGLSKVRHLLPFSDAKEGPLSSLTLSGTRVMSTLGQGITKAAPDLVKTTGTALAGVAAATAISIPTDLPVNAQLGSIPSLQAQIIPSAFNVPDIATNISNDISNPSEAPISPIIESQPSTSPPVPVGSDSPIGTTQNQDKKLIVHGGITINLSNIKDADGFVSELQRFVEEFDHADA